MPLACSLDDVAPSARTSSRNAPALLRLQQRVHRSVAFRGGDAENCAPHDPASGTWTVTGSLNTAREFHTATLLPNGMVLVAGGVNGIDVLASAELYDPASGGWTVTGSLNTARFFHTATLLPNGMVLAAAGESSSFSADASAELYTPGPTPTPTPTPRATPRPRPTPHPRPTPPFSPTPTATPIATPTPTPTVTPTPTPTATPQSLAAWERSFEKRHK